MSLLTATYVVGLFQKAPVSTNNRGMNPRALRRSNDVLYKELTFVQELFYYCLTKSDLWSEFGSDQMRGKIKSVLWLEFR